jgi:hypothetical protein
MNRSVHSDPKKPAPGSGKVQARTNDPERTMADILAVATREFAEKGLAGRASTTSPRPCAPASA